MYEPSDSFRLNPMVNKPKDVVLTRSNGVKIRRNTFKSKILNDFARQVLYLFNRFTPTWYALPEKIVQAPTFKMFKKGIDHRFKNNGHLFLL